MKELNQFAGWLALAPMPKAPQRSPTSNAIPPTLKDPSHQQLQKKTRLAEPSEETATYLLL